MSAFECNVTPTRIRNARKRTEDKEPTVVDLRPFTGKSIVTFEEIPITKIARRTITVINPFSETLSVKVTRVPKAEYNLALEWMSNEISSESSVDLELIWNPFKVVSCREMIDIADQFGNKKSVAVILKSCELRKQMMRKTGVMDYNKKLKLKGPSPPRMLLNHRHHVTTTTTSNVICTEYRENYVIEEIRGRAEVLLPVQMSPKRRFQQTNPNSVKSPLRNATNIQTYDDDNMLGRNYSNNAKENIAITPSNASALFDNIRFTPLTETKPKCESKLEYLSSLPTPTTTRRDDIIVTKDALGRKNILHTISPEIATPQIASRYTTIDETPKQSNDKTISKRLPAKLVLEQINDEDEEEDESENREHLTYIKPPSSNVAAAEEEINEIEIILTSDHKELLSNTQTFSTPPLRIEGEEKENRQSDDTASLKLQETFQVNKSRSLLENVISDTFECRPRHLSESMRDNEESPTTEIEKWKKCIQGSMPNLNEMNEPNFEHNRYFIQQQVDVRTQNLSMESVVSNVDFKEIETCAQSSRLNLNELGKPTKSSSPIIPEISSKSPLQFHRQPQQQIKMSTTTKKSPGKFYVSPTVQRVREEREFEASSAKKKLLTFSPPRSKISEMNEIYRRETFTVSRPGEMRVTNWKQQQSQHMFAIPKIPRDLSFRPPATSISQSLTSLASSMTSIASTCSMPVTSGRLYNENLINSYLKRDPFSASTTEDPFLSSSMYLDERTLDGIEKSFKKWLNALVTIPPDLETDRNEKIDVAKIFNEVQSKELTLPATKEIVCSQYYTARLDQLRASAIRFFHSEQISKPLNKLAVIINEKKLLEVHAARSIHLDLVLQRSLLELLLCFNPLWLRIGIEVVFNVQLNLTSNQDIIGMIRFIITHMFRSPYLQQKYTKYNQQQELLDKLKKHTAKNFLFLLFFLDRAKENRLIKQNPCLFIKAAPYKESAEILKKFASLVLANYGDIIRMMKRLDYVLTHKQTVIDEFDFAFKNLAVDLRDGVRLTKVMEVILLRDDLVKRVRVPAISRLQKVHNVELALKALEEADYVIVGNITSKDIADGHREKTLSLLWQIIYKFRAPRFNAAAKTIQKFWRSKWLKIVIERRIRMKEEEKLNNAAVTIQKHFRGWQLRKSIKEYRERVTRAVITIQRYTRLLLERKRATILMEKERNRYLKLKQLVPKIQARFRGKVIMQQVRKEFLRKRTAAVKIQQFWQATIEMRKQREQYANSLKLIIAIQRRYRGRLLMKEVRNRFSMQKAASIKIQRFYRGRVLMKKERTEFLRVRAAALVIQTRYRAQVSMKVQRIEYLKQKNAANTLQKFWRSYSLMTQERSQYLRTVAIIKSVQSKFRGILKMRQARSEYQQKRSAIIKIQQRWRATMEMKKQQVAYRETVEKIVYIQRRFRAKRSMRTQKAVYEEQRSSIMKIQRYFRSYVEMKKRRKEFLELKKTVRVIESRVVANRMMKAERESFIRTRNLIIKVQQTWRAIIQMRETKAEYQNVVRHIVFIQRKYRAKLEMRKVRGQFIVEKISIIRIQTFFRGYLKMTRDRAEFRKTKAAIVALQRRYRARKAMQLQRAEFLKTKSSAVKIQNYWRGYVQMKMEREKFLKAISAIKRIQIRFRNKLAMRQVRNEFIRKRTAAIRIQKVWRATLEMRKQRVKYQESISKIIWIQRRVRAKQSMLLARRNYQQQKLAAVTLQRRYRARLEMRICRDKFSAQKQAAVSIQKFWRGYALMKTLRVNYLRTIAIIKSVQIKYRTKLAARKVRNDYLIKRSAAIKIQRRWRETLEMRKQRAEYEKTLNCIKFVQRKLRANLAMRAAVSNYQRQKAAAVKIQKWLRSHAEMRKVRNEFQLLKRTVIVIENRVIANRLMKIEREQFIEFREKVIFVQRRFRSKIETRNLQKQFKHSQIMILKIQCRVRGFLARKRFKELQTPENIEKRKRNKAARAIQAAWRGYKERSKKSNICFRAIVERLIKVSKNVDPTQTLAAKLKISIDFLKYRYDSNIAISTLAKLEYMSRTVPWILTEDAEFIAAFCYGIMAQAIRSEVDKQIIELCSCIILNLGRFRGTKEDAFQENGLTTIAQILLRWCDKDCGIFQTLCTLLWVFSHCDKKKKIIRKFMTMKDSEFIITHIKQNVLRKENMRKNSRHPIGFQSISLIKYKKDYQLQMRHQPQTVYSSGFITPEMLKQCRQLPSMEPDYGVVRMHPYIFYSSVFAFDTVLASLNINNFK